MFDVKEFNYLISQLLTRSRLYAKIPNAILLLLLYCTINIRVTFFLFEIQPGFLRHPILQRGLFRDRGAVGETSEVNWRRIRRTFYTKGHHVRVPVLPLAALPHHVHP